MRHIILNLTLDYFAAIDSTMQNIKIIIEKHTDGYIGYPVGLQGVVVGEGNTYEEALQNTQSAIRFHIESFGVDAIKKI